MTKEENKAIKEVKDILNKEISWGKNTSNDYKTVSELYMNGDVETLINLIETQQQENEKLREDKLFLLAKCSKFDYLNIKKYFIPKSKIEERIAELKEREKVFLYSDEFEIVTRIQMAQNILKELLES